MFNPYYDSVEVEPIDASSVIAGGNEKIEAARVIAVPVTMQETHGISDIHVGDVIFFRPHGFFELPEYEGKRRFIVKIAPEFILGIWRNNKA